MTNSHKANRHFRHFARAAVIAVAVTSSPTLQATPQTPGDGLPGPGFGAASLLHQARLLAAGAWSNPGQDTDVQASQALEAANGPSELGREAMIERILNYHPEADVSDRERAAQALNAEIPHSADIAHAACQQ